MMIKLYDRRGKGIILEREVHCPQIWEHGLPRDIWHYFTGGVKSEKMKNSYRFFMKIPVQ